ncbi:hypothetical protein Trydic_g717 [Trypoxylus dichotomus]
MPGNPHLICEAVNYLISDNCMYFFVLLVISTVDQKVSQVFIKLDIFIIDRISQDGSITGHIILRNCDSNLDLSIYTGKDIWINFAMKSQIVTLIKNVDVFILIKN